MGDRGVEIVFPTSDTSHRRFTITKTQSALRSMETTLNWYLSLSAVLFSIGVLGVLVKRNAIVLLMSVELMLNAVNLSLVAISQARGDATGQVLVFFVMAVAASEAAIGLALVIALFRRKETVSVTDITLFKF